MQFTAAARYLGGFGEHKKWGTEAGIWKYYDDDGPNDFIGISDCPEIQH